MTNNGQISLQEAQEIAVRNNVSVSIPTLINWIKVNELGHQPGGTGGKWYVFKAKFVNFIKGKS